MGNFTTNSRIVLELFAQYSNTFTAFCELINNSLQANATEIKITITENQENEIFNEHIKEIIIFDNGEGVSKSDFKKKILEIGTDSKPEGKGIGRFASLQIGKNIKIETVAYDSNIKKSTRSTLPLKGNDIEKNRINLDKLKLQDSYEDLLKDEKTYFQVFITDFYSKEECELDKKRKLHKNLLPENLPIALFQQYPLELINGKAKIYINNKLIDPKNYIIGNPIKIER
ncbi:MAG: ATP-binding protein, partial [Leptospiraceae bacterium]|nr:ATP-binding protein [Leptospiraceae bacterium]